MPKSKAFHRRIQVLDRCLRRRQRLWTVNALLGATNEHLTENGYPEVSLRTIYDDLQYLQSTLDAPVERFQQGKSVCYRYSDPTYTLVNSPLSPGEKEMLRKMLAYLKANNLPMQVELEGLLDRLGMLELEEAKADQRAAREINPDLAPGRSPFEELSAPPAAAPASSEVHYSLRKKSESAPAKPVAVSAKIVVAVPSIEELILNRLVLRMEDDSYSGFSKEFWLWLEDESDD
ncbi:hypothetical protein [Flavihumibacter petaseus]|uniref:WYL domain-containing protein n=1 Tax=Flavihumibacter petaseus NBRC 106054 TaxID=1220578 RepID=A0A0E9MYD9_9BACT|nr:hypothetical protein [Flavihumibacter petaseus]GAO42518.1 hypothetical protein FPE01S_01_15330 [Flavihumibacter petaseus NBRC 106054]